MPNVNLAGGAVDSNSLLVAATLTAGATVSVDPTAASVASLTPAQNETLNAVNVQDGQLYVLVVKASGTTSYTLTFGTNFKSTGTLATGTVDAKTFVVTFVGVGTNLVEVSRTAAQ